MCSRRLDSGLVRTAFLALLGEMLAGADRIDEGFRAVDEGFAHAEKTLEGGISRSSIVFATAYCCAVPVIRPAQRKACGLLSRVLSSSRRSPSSCAPRRISPGCSFQTGGATTRAPCSRRSSRGSPKATRRKIRWPRAPCLPRDRPVTSSGTPPLLVERVLEEEYAFLHQAPDEDATDRRRRSSPEPPSVCSATLAGHSALCLSGGGVRSGSFGLGVSRGWRRPGCSTSSTICQRSPAAATLAAG